METTNDTLSFHDIQVYDDMLLDSTVEDGFINKRIHCERPKLINRWIHTFLEWDTANEFIYSSGWSIHYASVLNHTAYEPLTIGLKVDTLQKAKEYATIKVNRYEGTVVHLEQDDTAKGDLYMAIDSSGAYRGMVEIKLIEGGI